MANTLGKFHAQRGNKYIKYNEVYIPWEFKKYIRDATDNQTFVIALPTGRQANNIQDIYNDPDYFSDKHGAYAEGYTLEARLKKYGDTFRKVTSLLPKDFSMYTDLGGGLGYYAYGIAQQLLTENKIDKNKIPQKIVVVDISQLFADEAKRLGIRKITSTLSDIPIESESVSVATCHHVLEHIPYEEMEKCLQEIYRILEPGGIFYGIIPTVDSPRTQNNRKVRDQIFLDETHLTLGTRSWWQNMFAKHHFIPRPDLEAWFDAKNYGWVFCYEKPKSA